MTNTNDFARIHPQHEEVDKRCVEWAKWVRVTQRPFGVQPMWRNYVSNARLWETNPVIPTSINILLAQEVEAKVALLPEVYRTVLRWAYVWPGLHPNAVARELKTTVADLVAIRNNALDNLHRAIIQ